MQLYTSQKQLNLGHPRNCHLENDDLGTLVCFWQPELLGIQDTLDTQIDVVYHTHI